MEREINKRLDVLERRIVKLLEYKRKGDLLSEEECDLIDALFEIREIAKEE